MAAERPPWERCSQDDCIGVRLPDTAWCLGHAAGQAPDAFDAELKRIGAEGRVDARGVVISAELLGRLLAAVPRKDGRRTFTVARFDWASFERATQIGPLPIHGKEGATCPDRNAAQYSPLLLQDIAALTLARDRRYLPAGHGRRDGQGCGPVGSLGRLLDVLGHRHHQIMVVPAPA